MTLESAPGGLSVGVVIPVKNEATALPKVLAAIPSWVHVVVVADTNSTDATPEIAAAMGARVVHEPRPGYGRACLAGLAAMSSVDVMVFLDGDASDDPSEMSAMLDPIATGAAEFVVGSSRNAGLDHLKIRRDIEISRHKQAMVPNPQDFFDAAGAIDPVRVSKNNMGQNWISDRLKGLRNQRRTDRASRIAAPSAIMRRRMLKGTGGVGRT